jgi:histidinol-phosphate/aromatic aminotransferase/cobyric acid decarboxylase-like protein
MSTTLGATCCGAPPPAAKANEPKLYRDVLTACSTSSILYLANPNNPKGVHMTSAFDVIHEAGICDDGFIMVVKKMRNNLAISSILPIQSYIKA